MFYLDYVGCKGMWCGHSHPATFSFISTMWDVKFPSPKVRQFHSPCFISTMWDVKIDAVVNLIDNKFVLSRLCGM